jgi:ribosomal protein S4
MSGRVTSRAKLPDPYNTSKQLLRMSWHVDNLQNLLSRQTPQDLTKKSVFQQRWIAKRELRAYHQPLVSEKQFFKRHFNSLLHLQIQTRKERENTPAVQALMFQGLERRLDSVVFRALLSKDIVSARKAVVKGKVKVNGEQCRFPARSLEGI